MKKRMTPGEYSAYLRGLIKGSKSEGGWLVTMRYPDGYETECSIIVPPKQHSEADLIIKSRRYHRITEEPIRRWKETR